MQCVLEQRLNDMESAKPN
ncbi:hypothetical protein LINPERPRIM_LOCUS21890 [Linum perenne]